MTGILLEGVGARRGGGGVIGSTLQETDPVPFSFSSYFLSSDPYGNFLLFFTFFFFLMQQMRHIIIIWFIPSCLLMFESVVTLFIITLVCFIYSSVAF